VHAELPTSGYEDAVLDVGDVYGARDLAADDQGVFDVSEVQDVERSSGCCRGREVDDAVLQVGYCA
jgi:hypothetical protein